MGYNIPKDHHGPTPGDIMDQQYAERQAAEGGLDQFLVDVEKEFHRARKKFPQPNPTVAAMCEEAGEVARQVLHIREGKSTSWWEVYNEAVQLASMAARIALEGDQTLNSVPTEKNYA